MKLSDETKEKIVVRFLYATGFLITGMIWAFAIAYIIRFIGDLI